MLTENGASVTNFCAHRARRVTEISYGMIKRLLLLGLQRHWRQRTRPVVSSANRILPQRMKWLLWGMPVVLLLLLGVMSDAFGANIPPDCNIAEPTTLLDKCKADDGSVTIGAGAPNKECEGRVSLGIGGSSSLSVGKITINTGGTLEVHDKFYENDRTASPELTTTGIDVNGGSLLIGDAKCPIGTINFKTTLTITFTGQRPAPSVCGDLALGATGSCPGYRKGIQVEKGGTLRMYGRKGVPPNGVNWTYLSQPAGDRGTYSKTNGVLAPPPEKSDSKTIYTAVRVDTGMGAWCQGDWSAIATTSFSPWETEFVQIESVEQDKDNPNATGSRITLQQSLRYYHFGGEDPGVPSAANYMAGAATNFGVDERAEIGLISRNIILTSDSDLPNTSNHWGGELKFLKGFGAVSLQGVELQKFGKEQIGSYPVHFH
jgi:hypothetical protein